MSQMFEVGDLVRISANTHDDRMPESRIGNVVEICSVSGTYSHDFCKIYFTNGITLRFHRMFLEKL